jgi:hypothetical protein
LSPPRPRAPESLTEITLVGALFCASGASALVYQVAWQRMLMLQSGVSVHSVAMIVAAFMVGLGLGSYLGGTLSARLTARRALLGFAGIELLVGLFAAGSCDLYYGFLYQDAPWLYQTPWRAALSHVLALLVPTTLMGMSLPFLVRAMVRARARAGGTIGYLYAWNVVGAGLGALLAPWVLIRMFGIEGAVLAGATANVLVGLGALATFRAFPPPEVDEPITTTGSAVDGSAEARGGMGRWFLLYALSGFCSLSLEIVWFRIVDVGVKSTAFTFGTVLAIYLLGLAAGTFLGVALVPRLERPLRAFLLCQCLLLAYASTAVSLLAWLPTDLPVYEWFYRYWPRYEGFQLGEAADAGALVRLYVLFPAALYALPTVLMGLSFVALQHAVQDEVRLSGNRVGSLQAANIVGGVLGSLGIGLASLTALGTAGTLRMLTACGLVFAAVGVLRHGARSIFTPIGALLAALLLWAPGQRDIWLRLHGASAEALIEEDATSVVALTEGGPQRWQMMVNGKGISWLPFGGVHSVMGAAPALIHPAPADIAIIGLGSADTAWAAACRTETVSAVVFEISGPQPGLLKALAAREPLDELRRFLADPRIRIAIADGRNALERDERTYDLIEADPLPPWGAGSGNLYSLEFFERCARRLKRGGVMCTWSPTPRVYATFCRVFPNALEFTHGQFQYLVGSNQPIEGGLDAWLARLDTDQVRAYLGPSIAGEVRASLTTFRRAAVAEEVDVELNRDLFPRDELRVP